MLPAPHAAHATASLPRRPNPAPLPAGDGGAFLEPATPVSRRSPSPHSTGAAQFSACHHNAITVDCARLGKTDRSAPLRGRDTSLGRRLYWNLGGGPFCRPKTVSRLTNTTILRTGRLPTPSMPEISSTLLARPPQPTPRRQLSGHSREPSIHEEHRRHRIRPSVTEIA
jgi:hypothetical protein